MGDHPANKDEAKGRMKQAAGTVTGNDDLEREGKVDRTVGGVKDAVDEVARKIKNVLDGNR